MKPSIFKNILLASLVLSLVSGCAAVHTAVKKRDLEVQTKMSASIFLDPVAPEKRVVFLQIRNTSDKPGLDVSSSIRTAISNRGYKITDNPDAAHYMIQANVLQVGKSDLREAQGALAQGYGSAAVGAVAGAQFGSGKGQVGAGLLGAAAGLIGDALVEDVLFSIITDLQISERARNGVVVTESNKARLKQGTSGNKSVTSTEETNWKRYQTRIMSTANKMNLQFAEAEPVLIKGLTQSISGLL